ncbi:MAG: exodeoxyribonuclease VII small subunit [Treponema sp.]
MKKFEQRLARLEEINDRIKDTEIPLEDAVALFEEGIKLAKTLEKDIDKIESKVQILMNQPVSASDSPELELFSGGTFES